MERPRLVLREELAIRKLVTFYYREMTKYFYASGERHDFWEFVYVDKGEVEIFTETTNQRLRQGEMIFYKPNVLHGGKAVNGSAPNLIILSFECTAPCMAFFEDKTFRLQADDRQLLFRIVQEGLKAFDPPIDSPRNTYPRRREGEGASFGGEQMIRNYLEILLLQLIRKGGKAGGEGKPSSVAGERQGDEVVSAIIRFLQSHVANNYTFDQLCEEFAISRTRLKMIFKEKTGIGVMEYFNRMKIEQAKRMIREEASSISEISERLGYSSNHYFSRQFKRITDMAPSEYMRSIGARTVKEEIGRGRW